MGTVNIKRTRRFVTAEYVPSIVQCGTCGAQYAENRHCPKCDKAIVDRLAESMEAMYALPEYDKPTYAPIGCGWDIGKEGV